MSSDPRTVNGIVAITEPEIPSATSLRPGQTLQRSAASAIARTAPPAMIPAVRYDISGTHRPAESRPRRKTGENVESPSPGARPELVLALVFELEARADDELADRPRDKDLARRGRALHALPDVDAQSADVATGAVNLSRVEACPDVDVQLLQRLADRVGAADRARRPVERRQEGVPAVFASRPPEATNLPPHAHVMLRLELPPFAVAQLGGALGGAHDVGEQDGGDGRSPRMTLRE